jgi:hypothetical protein
MLQRGKTVFNINSFSSGPGKYMQDLTDDKTFDDFIVNQMKNYIQLKIKYGSDFKPAVHANGFKPITGTK